MIRETFARPITLLLLTLGLFAGSAQALPFSGLVVLGDSLADSGNNAWVFDNQVSPDLPPGSLRTQTPIANPAFVPTFPYSSNRYSNGPVWVEYFAQALGLEALPSALGGSNFAFGSARAGPAGSKFPFSLLDQAAMFLAASGGTAPSGALYVVEGGGNDARDALVQAARGEDPTTVIADFAANVGQIVGQLVDAGARDILLANVPDIGKTPAVQALGDNAAQLATLLADRMNAALDLALAQLMLPSTADLRILDLFGLGNQLFADPTAFGMTDVTSACAFDPSCIANASTTFYWDGIHPTTAGHALIARLALAEIPLPATLALLLTGVFALLATRHNQRRTRCM